MQFLGENLGRYMVLANAVKAEKAGISSPIGNYLSTVYHTSTFMNGIITSFVLGYTSTTYNLQLHRDGSLEELASRTKLGFNGQPSSSQTIAAPHSTPPLVAQVSATHRRLSVGCLEVVRRCLQMAMPVGGMANSRVRQKDLCRKTQFIYLNNLQLHRDGGRLIEGEHASRG